MEILKLVSYFDLSKYSALYELSVAEWCYVVWRYRSTLVKNNNITKLHTLHHIEIRQNGPQFAKDISKLIFLSENYWILIQISL